MESKAIQIEGIPKVEGELSMPSGRLDIFAEGNCLSGTEAVPFVLAIEAKIDAREGEKQLDKYDLWIEGRQEVNGCILRVFLTPDRLKPETSNKWSPMSFEDLSAILWSASDRLKQTPGYHFLRYYLAGVLRDICGWPRQISADCRDPYAVLDYLKAIRQPKEITP